MFHLVKLIVEWFELLEKFIKSYGIGLTGGIASGKSTVAEILAKNGWQVIDADVLSREVVAPNSPILDEICRTFGSDVISEDGTLNRSALKFIVFGSARKKSSLESIVHPAIHEKLKDKIRALRLDTEEKYWFYEASLLYETGRYKDFGRTWVVHCKHETQISRLMMRDGIDRVMAEKIVAGQMPTQKKIDMADYVINTDGTFEETRKNVEVALTQLLGSMNQEDS